MQNHIIQQQMFDVGFPSADKSYQLQSKISDIFHNQLSDAMEQLFSRLVPANVVLSMGDVSIDAGNIVYDQLEFELTDRILAELEREIKGRLALLPSGNADENPQSDIKTLEGSYASLLEYFLLSGTIPWWASGEVLTDPVKVMEHLLTHDTERLKQLIINVGQHSYVRQRLVQQFTEKVIRDIITVLEPAQATFIFDYHATVSKTHHEEKLVESAPATEFEKALWLFILTYILVDRGSLFNQKMFVSVTLNQIARHYNRAYADILALLAKALVKYNVTDRQSSELLFIINELSVDEFDDRHIIRQRSIKTAAPIEEETVLQNLEVIKHYLVFGSLPWWSEPYGDSNLAGILLELIRVIPQTLRKLIVTVGQNEEVRKRITTVFNDEVITGIVKILEPADATFIINYVAEVQDIHVKKPVVYTDSKDFKKAIWKFVFDFLLTERGSDFNRRMFLKSNIRRLADNYNVQYFEMLMYLVQSIGQVHQDNIDQAPLFKLLAVLLNDNDYNEGAEITPGSFKKQEAYYPDTEKKKQVVLKDVLLHWLTYGNIPWWGSAYFEQGPANMFLSLLAMAPNDAFMLLKYAGTVPNIRKRVIYQLPAELVIDAFAHQTTAQQAVKHYQYLLPALTDIIKTVKIAIIPAEIETALLVIFWDVYIAGQYKTFNDGVFIQKALYYLLKQSGTVSKQSKLVVALKQVFGAGAQNQAGISDVLKRASKKGVKGKSVAGSKASGNIDQNIYLQSLEAILAGSDSEEEFSIDDIVLQADETNQPIDISQLIAVYLSAKAPTEQEITAEILRILEHFVNTQKLPSQFKGTNPAYIIAVVKQLLQYLGKTSPKALKQLLAKTKILKQYIGGSTPVDEAMAEKQDAAKSTGLDTEVKIDGSIEQLISAYLHREKQTEKNQLPEAILKEALTLLQYFLTNGKLPDALNVTSAVSMSQILKQLVLTLHYARPAALNDILQREDSLAEAKMQLHNLFVVTQNTAENNVAHALKTHLEKDIIRYLKTVGTKISDVDDKLGVLIEKYLDADVAGNEQLITAVLQQPSAARYVARYFTNQQVQRMLGNQTNVIGGSENLVWLGDLHILITAKVTDTLQRDRLNSLIREFNLMTLGGHISVGSFTNYVKELFRFIASQNNTLFTSLAGVLTKADAAPHNVSAIFKAKLSAALTELGIQKANTKAEQDVKKQLDKSNADALQNPTDPDAAKQKAAEAKQVKEEIKQTGQQQQEEARKETKKLLTDQGDAIYINNAGLVLLNPFIATFLIRTGVMNGGKFVSEEAQQRAVHLLQYLVDGSSNSPEHMLVLNKILCNLPIDEPVPAEITLTDAEKEVAAGLLNAVLGNWDKLKNTTVDGLRGSFLIRDGSLVFKDDAWNLKIEQRGYDVLLQTLPWGIGMIKMPWMDKFLYVEWI
ncbi:contractile injection system tape measure protein [Mucilaginibacter sp. AW1-3]